MLSVDLAAKGTTGLGRKSAAQVEGLGRRLAIEFEVEAVGATPTVTYTVQGSLDGTNWFDLQYVTEDSAVAAAKTAIVTTAVSKKFVYLDGLDKRFFRHVAVNVTANTNVTYSARVHGTGFDG